MNLLFPDWQSYWNNFDPGFSSLIWLGLIPLIVMVFILLEWASARYRRQALALFVAPQILKNLVQGVSQFKRLLKSALMITAISLIFFALARPHLFYTTRDEVKSGIDILLAVDCSRSMLTPDVKPNRLERAKLAISDLADNLPDSRLGLIAFAGDAFLECPLTLDREAFKNSVQDLDTEVISRPGTDIGEAITASEDALKNVPSASKVLILVTDGEDLEGHAFEADHVAAEQGIKIYTVGVGTPEGDLIPLTDSFGNTSFVKFNGDYVHSKLDETALRSIARITGGAYTPLGQRGEGLEFIYHHYLAKLTQDTQEKRHLKIRDELFMWPLALAWFLLIAEFLLRDQTSAQRKERTQTSLGARYRKTPSPVLAAWFLFWAFSAFGLKAAVTDEPEQAYKNGKYDAAEEGYEKAAESDPDQAEYQYNLGVAAFKAGDYLKAENAFRRALKTPDLSLQQRSYYNLGNAQFRRGEGILGTDINKTQEAWEEALKSYEFSVQLKSTDKAVHNEEYVKRRLEELKKQKQNQQQNQNKQSSDGKGNNQTNSSGQQDKPQDQSGDKKNPQSTDAKENKDSQNPASSNPDGKKDQGQSPDQDKDKTKTQGTQSAQSQNRDQDIQDPGTRSRAEAAALLDSLKGDDKQMNSKSFDRDPRPPTDSQKDW